MPDIQQIHSTHKQHKQDWAYSSKSDQGGGTVFYLPSCQTSIQRRTMGGAHRGKVSPAPAAALCLFPGKECKGVRLWLAGEKPKERERVRERRKERERRRGRERGVIRKEEGRCQMQGGRRKTHRQRVQHSPRRVQVGNDSVKPNMTWHKLNSPEQKKNPVSVNKCSKCIKMPRRWHNVSVFPQQLLHSLRAVSWHTIMGGNNLPVHQ